VTKIKLAIKVSAKIKNRDKGKENDSKCNLDKVKDNRK
jgi:hypothetical protein